MNCELCGVKHWSGKHSRFITGWGRDGSAGFCRASFRRLFASNFMAQLVPELREELIEV